MHISILYISQTDPNALDNFDINRLEQNLIDKQENATYEDLLFNNIQNQQLIMEDSEITIDDINELLGDFKYLPQLFTIDSNYKSNHFIKLDMTRKQALDYLEGIVELQEDELKVRKDQLNQGIISRINKIDLRDFYNRSTENIDKYIEIESHTKESDYEGYFGYIDDINHDDNSKIRTFENRFNFINDVILNFDLYPNIYKTSVYIVKSFSGLYKQP